MQFPESWLRTFANPDLDTEALCHILTMAGLEVEEIKINAGGETCITIKLTPNRADCFSVYGIARETAALTGATLQPLPPIRSTIPASAATTPGNSRSVVLDAPTACARYCGRHILGINSRAATPAWIEQRLHDCGLRSISAVVDITNYVMLELGQPLHAFDDAKLVGAIHVRWAHAGESLVLLNEQEIKLDTTMLVITDEAKVLALAGIMGGLESGVGNDTLNIFLESAWFAPAAIAGRARTLGFSSDAAHRFERGVDPTLQRLAIERASQLILEICGGTLGPILETLEATHLPERKPITLRPQRLARLLGINLDSQEIKTYLTRLGCACESLFGSADLIVLPPSWRFDLNIEADLIEEVARLVGYDQIPARPPQAALAMLHYAETQRSPMHIRQLLAARGYLEVINYSFVDPAWEQDFCANSEPIRLANPIASQMSVMRSSLIGGLVNTLATNSKRQQPRQRLFEIGRCFLRTPSAQETTSDDPDIGLQQPQRLAVLASGSALPEQWGSPLRRTDFFDVRGEVEALFAPRRLRFVAQPHPAFHPGRSAGIFADDDFIGCIGELHPAWVQRYTLKDTPVLFEVDLDALCRSSLPVCRAQSRLPAVLRDLAFIAAQDIPLTTLLTALQTAAPKIVRDITLFDLYSGKGLPAQTKSLAFRIVLQDTEHTLEDAQCDAACAVLIAAAERCGARLRT